MFINFLKFYTLLSIDKPKKALFQIPLVLTSGCATPEYMMKETEIDAICYFKFHSLILARR